VLQQKQADCATPDAITGSPPPENNTGSPPPTQDQQQPAGQQGRGVVN